MKEVNEELLGKFAYKKYGFFSHLIGKIERSTNGITPYVLVSKSGTRVAFTREKDIVLVELNEAGDTVLKEIEL